MVGFSDIGKAHLARFGEVESDWYEFDSREAFLEGCRSDRGLVGVDTSGYGKAEWNAYLGKNHTFFRLSNGHYIVRKR